MNFSVKHFFSKYEQIRSKFVNLFWCTKEIFNGKLHFLRGTSFWNRSGRKWYHCNLTNLLENPFLWNALKIRFVVGSIKIKFNLFQYHFFSLSGRCYFLRFGESCVYYIYFYFDWSDLIILMLTCDLPWLYCLLLAVVS